MKPVVKLETLLLRVGGSLDFFIGSAVVEVLKAINPDSVKPSNLTGLVIKSVETHSMLQDPRTRNVIINAMRPNEAEKFAHWIGVKEWEDVYYKLSHVRFTKAVIKRALEFFGEKYHEEATHMAATHSKVEPPRPLFPHQLKTVEEVRKKLVQEPHRALLHMPTGSGKTISAIRLILTDLLENSSGLVIWLAHSEELCEQAMQEFQQTWKYAGDRPIDTYRFYGRHSLDLLKIKNGFVVASLLKMLVAAKNDIKFLSDIAQKTRIVVIDEAHQSTAQKFSVVIEELTQNKNTRLLGLSATPGRKSDPEDPANIHLAKFFRNRKIVLNTGNKNPVKFLVANKYLAQPKFKKISYGGNRLSNKDILAIEENFDIPKHILVKLSMHVVRNLEIINEIIRLAKTHKKIIVFASEVEHAKSISQVLSAQKYNSHYITSKTPHNIRSAILRDYRFNNTQMILCNYGILTTGFDAPKTSAVVIARPTKSHVLYAQMVGRGIRGTRAGGNNKCEISTIVDSEIVEFAELADIFTQWDVAWNE